MHATEHRRDDASPRRAEAQPGKYLTFRLAGEIYGLPVFAVREIIRLLPITPVASMPAHVRGVINLRGKVIPVVDLRTRFGLTTTPDNDRTCIIVAQVAVASGSRAYGVVVEGLEEVVAFKAGDIEPTPDFGGAVDVRFITGIATPGSTLTTLIDLDAIAAADFRLAETALSKSVGPPNHRAVTAP
ncbi:MAG: chemotaxis protein CheW [Planctomycetes bacterium]|nr:chemotaxis protein CheW [Planctomycetota bacterium]